MKRLLVVGAIVLFSLARPAQAADDSPPSNGGQRTTAISLSSDHSHIDVSGLPDAALDALRQSPPDAKRWSEFFSLYVDGDNGAAALPVMGQSSIDGGVFTFTPRFPLRPGLTYRAVLNTEGLPALSPAIPAHMEQSILVPEQRTAAPTEVTAVYPTADELPENLLKFYIHFSAPMRRGDAYRHIRILDANDREIPGAYLRLTEELWTPDGRRFTLLFDPGRIKRGLVPHEEEGTPLVAGREYTLAIDAGWRDAMGNPLAAGFRKEFRTAAADESQPNPKAWKIMPPSSASRAPLVIAFDEPLDHALAQRMIAVREADGNLVEGSVTIAAGEQRWLFAPTTDWTPGRYALVIDGMLEDRAGNSPGRPFEVANAGEEVGVTAATEIELPFEIADPRNVPVPSP
jgi:hypothetical protein